MRGNASPADAEWSSTIRNVGKHRRADGIAPRGKEGTDQKNGEAAQHPGEEQDEGDVLRRGKGVRNGGQNPKGGKRIRKSGKPDGKGGRHSVPGEGTDTASIPGAKQSRTACL